MKDESYEDEPMEANSFCFPSDWQAPKPNLAMPCETCGHHACVLFNGMCEVCIEKYRPALL